MGSGVLLIAALCQTVAAASASLNAGAGSARIAVPPGTPLAGYGSFTRRLIVPDLLGRHPHAFWFKPHVGELDELMSKVLVLETDSARLVWVTLDVVAVDRLFTVELAKRIRGVSDRRATVIVSASHTHSGPGAFLDSEVMGFMATDRRDTAVRDALIASVMTAVRHAEAVKRPARVAVARTTAASLTTGRLARPIDAEIVVMRFVAEGGAPIAVVWNYAIHGTMVEPQDLRFSGDVTGLASRRAEDQLSVPVMFVNGAVADVSPRQHGHAAAVAASRELGARVSTASREALVAPRTALNILTRTVVLPAPHLSLRNCLGRWIPRGLTLPLTAVFPREAELIGVGLGPVVWVAVPGELQSVLGAAIKQSASQHWQHAFIAGLSNDYLGYFVTADDYHRPSYVTCANVYGPAAGDDLARAASALLADLAKGTNGE